LQCEWFVQVIYVTTHRQGNRIYRNEVNLITQLSQGSSTGQVQVVTLPYPLPGGGGQVVPVVPATTPRPVTFLPTLPPATLPPRPVTTAITFLQRGVHVLVPGLTVKSGSSVSFNFKTINPVQ
jgi:hypothetical protein